MGHAYSGDGGRATSAQLWNPTGLTVDGAGDVYVPDSSEHMQRVIAQGDMRPMSDNRDAMSDLSRILSEREVL